MRGYSAIGLWHPRDHLNVGSVLRAAGAFDASLVVVQGKRYRHSGTDTMKAFRHLPLLETDDLLETIPHACVPVAVECVEGSRDLPTFVHPESAYYIFGPEDGSLPASVLSACRHVVSVPSGCLNLAMCVNVVLYDRMAKRQRRAA